MLSWQSINHTYYACPTFFCFLFFVPWIKLPVAKMSCVTTLRCCIVCNFVLYLVNRLTRFRTYRNLLYIPLHWCMLLFKLFWKGNSFHETISDVSIILLLLKLGQFFLWVVLNLKLLMLLKIVIAYYTLYYSYDIFVWFWIISIMLFCHYT